MRTGIDLAPFEDRHLDAAVGLSRAAGWLHRREDWALALACGEGVVALDAGSIVGTAIATFNGTDHATICMVIVDAARRGAGLGRRLTMAALDLCGDREARLTATRDGRPLYESLGFVAHHVVVQHQGMVDGAMHAEADPPASRRQGRQPASSSLSLAIATPADLPAIVALDRAATGMDRAGLFGRLAGRGGFVVAHDGAELKGFAGAREFGRGVVVGPAAADTADTARAVIGAQLAAHAGRFLRVDAPAASGLSPWLDALGLARTDEGLAMRRPGRAARAQAPSPFATYALAAQALG